MAKKGRKRAKLAAGAGDDAGGLDEMFDKVGGLADEEKETADDDGGVEADGSDLDEEQDTVEQHKDELERLKKADPDFYRFLQDNDSKLLDFGDDDDVAESDRASDDEDISELPSEGEDHMDEEESDGEPDDSEASLRLDFTEIKQLEAQLGKSDAATLRVAKVIMRAFRAGCLMSTATRNPDSQTTSKKKMKRKAPVSEERDSDPLLGIEIGADGSLEAHGVYFSDGRAYQRIMTISAQKAVHQISKQLGCPSSGTEARTWVVPISSKTRKVLPVIKSYASNLLNLAQSVNDEPTARLLLKRCEDLLPYLTVLPKLDTKLVKVAVIRWASSCSENTFIRALLLLKALASGDDPERTEHVLKWTYRTFRASIASKCNHRTLPRIELAARSIVELHGIDFASSYSHAFIAIRELALDLRAALSSKDKTEIQRVHNWQYINSLRVWSLVLSAFPRDDQLQPLIYPFTQITLAVMRLVPVPKNFGVRFHCGRFLVDLAASSSTFIPLAPVLLEALTATELKRSLGGMRSKDDNALGKLTDWRVTLRVPESSLGTAVFAESVVRQVCLLLAMYFSALSRHAALPEAAYHAVAYLKRVIKSTKIPSLREEMRCLVSRLDENSKYIEDKRAACGVTPQSVTHEGFQSTSLKLDSAKATPLESLVTTLKQRVQNENRLLDSSTAMVGTEDKETETSPQRQKKKTVGYRERASRVLSRPINAAEDEDIVAPLSSDDESDS